MRFIEHFVPIKDSMGEITAVLEVFIATAERRPPKRGKQV
jgi:hypothetical protein